MAWYSSSYRATGGKNKQGMHEEPTNHDRCGCDDSTDGTDGEDGARNKDVRETNHWLFLNFKPTTEVSHQSEVLRKMHASVASVSRSEEKAGNRSSDNKVLVVSFFLPSRCIRTPTG